MLQPAYAKPGQVDLFRSEKFALGIGLAVVKFDTKMKFTDKQSGDKVFIDPEGNLDLPEVSRVTTLYGIYNFNSKHSVGFSFF